ncbi:corazonin [Megachile rotundata]|uniref:corazonin n=1 Tax=Megachile rotundata TaxID=143995 RepID=UPI000258E9C4|nr:PREDICTED: pro-corazonin [Megachile rotundata]XP_012147046.1 PREDICTED: pro-corazonin [Megachile rotundata]
MVVTRILLFFVFSLTMTTVICQTFQYSHGWTNGKRSVSSMLEELVNSPSKNAAQLDNVLVNCELQKLRLLLQGNINSQVLQHVCDFYDSPKRNIPEIVVNEHFRRQSSSTSNNY